jgi:CRISPR-associated protein Csm5
MNYRMTLTTMTPLHIGTGTELLNEYDFKVVEDKTYRLNVDAVLDYVLSGNAEQIDRHLLNTPPGQLVQPQDLPDHPELTNYMLDGTPQPKTEGAGRVREQIKDAYGRLYLPGSSLKGALRTAIARGIGRRLKAPLPINDRPDRRGRANAKRAGDRLEASIFRPGRNQATHDLLRALQVADSQPVQADPLLINVRVVKGDKQASPIDVEAVPPGVTFETRIHLDDYLTTTVAAQLGWEPEQTRWLHNLPVAGRNLALHRFRAERDYFAQAGLSQLAGLYAAWLQELAELKGGDTFFLQIGWGGGWGSKTVGRALLAGDEAGFARLRSTFNLGRPPKGGHNWQPQAGDVFPASRRLAVTPNGQPIAPLGWLRASIREAAS